MKTQKKIIFIKVFGFTELEVIPLQRSTHKSDTNQTQSLFKLLTGEEVDTIMLTIIMNFVQGILWGL